MLAPNKVGGDINAETEVESPRPAFPLEQEREDEEVLGAGVFC